MVSSSRMITWRISPSLLRNEFFVETLHAAGKHLGIKFGFDVFFAASSKCFAEFRLGKQRIHRTPTLGEAAACRPWLEEEIALVKPEMIVCLGATAARSLLGAEFRLTRRRGEILESTSWAPRVMATWHPSAVLRIPDEAAKEQARRELVADMKKVQNHVTAIASSPL